VLLSCTCSPSSSSALTADLARCEPSKLYSVERPGARRSPQALANAAKCCSAAITRDLSQPPTNTQLHWVGERELVLVDRADTLPTSCRTSRAEKAVAHSEKACSCSMLDVAAKGGGELRGTKSHQQMLLLCPLRSTIEDVVAQL
jgi:hypothetical protein